MKILTRYILREHAGPMVAALSVLVGLMLLNQLAKRFGDLVGKGLPWYLIAEVFGLSIPFILAMTMPMAVLAAVLHTFNRLSSDNEITAIRAGGVSLIRLMTPVLLASTLVAGGMIWFNDTILPESNHALRRLLVDIGRKQPTFELRERVVNEIAPAKLFLQAAQIDRVHSVLYDLVIFDLGHAEIQRTIYADSGRMAFNESQTDLYLTLYDGSMHETDRGSPETDQVTYYTEQVIRVSDVSNELERGMGTNFRGDREMSLAMMREEVQSRRERLVQIEDSVALLIGALAPKRESASRTGKTRAKWLLKPSGERVARVTPPSGGEEGVESESEAPEASGDDAAETATRRRRGVPRIALMLQRVAWPPTGSAATFASRTRAELQRHGGRYDLNRREINRYMVEIHKKYAIPVAAVVFVLIGAPVGVRFRRGGVGMVIGISLAVFCVYYVFLIGGEDLADRSIISPFWAMWAPNVLFASLGGLILYYVSWGNLRIHRRLPTSERRAVRVAAKSPQSERVGSRIA